MTSHNVVSFSGGRTSAYMVYLIEQMRKSGEITGTVEYIFMDTGAEHPKTYEFIKKCVEHFGIELTCLQGDFEQPVGFGHRYKVVSVDDLKHDMINGPFGRLMAKYGVPTVASAWCTSRMKEETNVKYCNDKYGKCNYTTWIGIRYDEPKRLRIGKNPLLRYLAELSDFEKDDVLDFWSGMPFDLEIQEHLGNCVFCIKKSINKIALAAKDEPELANHFIDAINAANGRINDVTGIPKGVMFRGSNSLQSIVAKFELHSRDEVYDTIRSMKRKESGGCTESCEAFACQIDLVNEPA